MRVSERRERERESGSTQKLTWFGPKTYDLNGKLLNSYTFTIGIYTPLKVYVARERLNVDRFCN